MTEKKYIILTDIKEFTYKNALLTNTQIEEMLQVFDEVVMTSADQYDISIIKSIWDAYLAISDSAQNAVEFTKDILSKTQKYDANHKISIKKMDLRVALTYGSITKNKSMNLDDYFWECINLASRIIDITPAWKIFLSWDFMKQLSKDQDCISLWKHDFHGVIQKTELFTISQMSREEIKSLTLDENTLLQECDKIVFRSACVSAILSAQPLPFVESFNIVWVHLYMIVKLSQKLERGVTLRSGAKIFKEVVTPLWAGYFGSQWLGTLAKIVLPWIGWYLFSPISFAVTYGMWKVYTSYFIHMLSDSKLPENEIIWIFSKQKDMWRTIAKSQKKDILKTGKKFYKDVMWIRKKSEYSEIQKDLISMLKSQK